MIPQRPPHVSQELWDLELPSILGVAHPSASILEDDSGDGDGDGGDDASPLSVSADADAMTVQNAMATVFTVDDSSDEDATAHDISTHSEPLQSLRPALLQTIAQTGVTQSTFTSFDADWGEVWNMDGAAHYYHLRLLTDTLPPLVTRESPMIEQLSCLICSRGGCDASQLAQLCRLLPEQKTAKRRRTTVTDGDTGLHQCTFSVGAFAIGGCIGVQRNTHTISPGPRCA